MSPPMPSIYLSNPVRRDAFRQARRALFAARGERTILAEQSCQHGIIMNHSTSTPAPINLPAECVFVLVDGELVYPLKIGINTVGRFLDSDVFLCEKEISRRHCVVLVHTNGTCDLHDTASRNGTLLNGTRISQPTALRSRDRIRLHNREFVFMSVFDLQGKRVTAIDGDTWHE
jgi:hypothetical protein